jgi:predicted nucleic acid-binding protein
VKTLIVDANVAIKWFLPEIHKHEALRLLNPVSSLHVPSLFLLEFGNVVVKKLRRHEISLEVAHQVIAKVQTIPLKWHPDAPLFPKAFQIANDTYRSLYDCLYLSLALAIDGQMVTADLKFYESLKTGPYANRLLWVEDIPESKE